jgi:hypothetical protein
MQDEILNFLKDINRPLSMSEISHYFKSPQRIVSLLVKDGKLKKEVYCFGSGGLDGLGFRTRPWTYVYTYITNAR